MCNIHPKKLDLIQKTLQGPQGVPVENIHLHPFYTRIIFIKEAVQPLTVAPFWYTSDRDRPDF